MTGITFHNSGQQKFDSLETEAIHYDGNPTAIVYKRDGKYYADGPNGRIDSGTTAHTVINNAIPNRTAGAKRRQAIKLVGNFEMEGGIDLESHTVLDLQQAYMEVKDGYDTSRHLIDGSDGVQHSVILGGYINGDKDNVTEEVAAIRMQGPSSATTFNTGGHNLIIGTRIEQMSGGNAIIEESRRDVLIDVRVENSAVHGINLLATDIAAIFCLSRDAGVDGWQVNEGHCHLYKCIGASCGRRGLWLKGGDQYTWVNGGFYENNEAEGIYVTANKNHVSPAEVIANGRGGSAPGIIIEGNRNQVKDTFIYDPNSTPTQTNSVLVETGAADTQISDVDDTANPSGIDNNGTRTRYNNVIGGGPLGGVDISTVTGAEVGDIARTAGTSAAGADVLAVYDGTDWVYPTRGGTVTPS